MGGMACGLVVACSLVAVVACSLVVVVASGFLVVAACSLVVVVASGLLLRGRFALSIRFGHFAAQYFADWTSDCSKLPICPALPLRRRGRLR